MICPKCKTESKYYSNGFDKNGSQKVVCKTCKGNSYLKHWLDEAPVNKEPSIKGISEAELRNKYDANFIVKQAILNLKEGVFVPEPEFIKQLRLNSNIGYRSVLEHPDFEKYRGRAGGVKYWSHEKSIRKLKDDGVLM